MNEGTENPSRLKPVSQLVLVEHTPWVFWIIVGWHLIWATGLLLRPESSRLFVVVGLQWLFDIGMASTEVSLFLFLISSLAIYGLIREKHLHDRTTICMLIGPQYATLLISFLADFTVLISGTYLNSSGQTIPVDRVLTMMILGLLMWAAVIHSVAFLERYVYRWSPRC